MRTRVWERSELNLKYSDHNILMHTCTLPPPDHHHNTKAPGNGRARRKTMRRRGWKCQDPEGYAEEVAEALSGDRSLAPDVIAGMVERIGRNETFRQRDREDPILQGLLQEKAAESCPEKRKSLARKIWQHRRQEAVHRANISWAEWCKGGARRNIQRETRTQKGCQIKYHWRS